MTYIRGGVRFYVNGKWVAESTYRLRHAKRARAEALPAIAWRIQQEVARRHNISTPRDIIGPYQYPYLSAPRREMAKGLRDLGYSITEIGSAMKRDHTTISAMLSARIRADKHKRYVAKNTLRRDDDRRGWNSKADQEREHGISS